MSGRLTKPVLVVLFSALALVSVAVAGSLTPSGPVAATMHSLANIYDSIASATFDSSAVVANQNGSLIASLKYVENQTAWASSSGNIWNLNGGNVGIGTTNPTTKFALAGTASVSGNILVKATTPVQIASLSDGNNVTDVMVVGNYAYVPTAFTPFRITIYDITNPASPSAVARITDCMTGSSNTLGHLWATNRLLAVQCSGSGQNNIRLYDVSKPANPKFLSAIAPGGFAWQPYINGKYIYISLDFGGGIVVYDISNPNNPVLVKNFSAVTGRPLGLAMQGRYLYNVEFDSSRFNIYDVEDLGNMYRVGSASLPAGSGPHGVNVFGRYAYIGTNSGVRIYDVSNPASPSYVSLAATGGSFTTRSWVADKYLYVSTQSGFVIFDISDIRNPFQVGIVSYSAGGYPAVQVSGKYAYVAAGTVGFKIFDIAGIETPGISGGSLAFLSGDIGDILNVGRLDVKTGADIWGSLNAFGGSNIYASSSVGSVLRLSQALSAGGNLLEMWASNSRSFYFQASTSGNVNLTLQSPSANRSDGKFTIRSAGLSDRLDILNGANSALVSIASTGNVGIGTANPTSALVVNRSAGAATIVASGSSNGQFAATSGNGSTGVYLTSYRSSAFTHTELLGQAARGTSGSPSALLSGDDMLYLNALGYTGSAFSDVAGQITFEAARNFSPTSNPTNILFSTTASGSTSLLERMRIDSQGNVGIGSTAPGALLTVSGTASVSGNIGINTNKFFVNATSGNVGIGTKNLITDKLEIVGTASISGQLATRGGITSPGTGTTTEQFGASANASGNGSMAIGANSVASTINSLAIGNGATAQTGTGAFAIGFSTFATGPSGMAIGNGAFTAGNSALAVGVSAIAAAQSSLAIGLSASVSIGATGALAIGPNNWAKGARSIALGGSNITRATDVIAIGSGVHADTGQIVMGSTTTLLTNLFFNLSSSSTPGAFTINGTGGAGTDVVGANLTIAGGRGTGAARGGSIIFQTANGTTTGSTLNTLATRMTIVASGSIGIGTTGPVHLVHIASSGDGNILRLQDTSGTCDHNPEAGSETVTCSSDISLKTNIVDAPSVLPYFADFRIRSYTIIASGKPMTGVIAQELRLTHPELVATGSDGLLMVQEPNPWLLVKGIQELTASSLMLDQLLTTETISTEPSGPLARLVHNVLAFIEQVFHVRIGDGEVKADRLCAGDTCVNSEQLLRILEKSGMSADTPIATPTPTPSDSPTVTPAAESVTPTPEITQLPAETATPTPSDAPTPTSTPSDTSSPEATATP